MTQLNGTQNKGDRVLEQLNRGSCASAIRPLRGASGSMQWGAERLRLGGHKFGGWLHSALRIVHSWHLLPGGTGRHAEDPGKGRMFVFSLFEVES